MTTEHLCFHRRPSSVTRVFRILESLSKSDSFLDLQFIVTGATHVKSSKFVKSCEKNDARIYLQRKMKTSFFMRTLPIPKPIDFVVSLHGQQLVGFIQSIDQFLIAKIFVVGDDDFKAIIHTLCNSACPVADEEFTIKTDYFIYGFDFDVQDSVNPVEELHSCSSMPNDLRLYFD